jgi:REP element-mobilizing transposase RayT
LRIEYPGAIYHVMSRGNQRERIFRDETDRRLFLAALEAAVGKTQWQVHAYCLMSNHFHLVVETPQANLVAGMKWLLGVYTKRFNIRHQLCGHLFAGRYQALVVDGSGNGYLKTVCDYVHLNPVRAKLLSLRAPLRSFGWSTYRFYLLPPGQRPEWLRVDRLLGEWGIPKDSAAGRAEFERRMEQRRAEDLGAEFKPVERGWCLGGETFRAELLEAVAARMGRAITAPVSRKRWQRGRSGWCARGWSPWAGPTGTWRAAAKGIRARCGWHANCGQKRP